MHRFFTHMVDGQARFSRAQSHQIRKVLRLRDGDEVAVFDGSGQEWLTRLSGTAGEIVRPIDRSIEPETRLTVFQALIKPARLEYVFQKGTELGVCRFVPFVAERSVATGEHEARWRAITVEAAEQSGRRVVPEVAPVQAFEDALADATSQGVPFMPWECVDRPKLSAVHRHARDLAVIIGPEGGFTEAEVERARARGAMTVTLGKRILRSETAAIVAATLLLHLNGEL